MKNAATELGIILIGYFTLVPAIQVMLQGWLRLLAAIWGVCVCVCVCVCVRVGVWESCHLMQAFDRIHVAVPEISNEGRGRRPNFQQVLALN